MRVPTAALALVAVLVLLPAAARRKSHHRPSYMYKSPSLAQSRAVAHPNELPTGTPSEPASSRKLRRRSKQARVANASASARSRNVAECAAQKFVVMDE